MQSTAEDTAGRQLIPIEFERQFLAELDAGKVWYENIVRQEELWISYQPDPEIESDKPSQSEREAIVERRLLPILSGVGLALAGLGCLGMLYSIRVFRRRVSVANDESSRSIS